ncbi:MAG TPA: hypothetical protein VFD49_23845 [Candidatus Dormibacteraeota bacterium]|jgi:hypothetical protein|nr:hypothetical protein [Candidatus Dormibacteraeota bacterium]
MRLGWVRVMGRLGLPLTGPVSRRFTKRHVDALFDLARQRPEVADDILFEIRRRGAA